MTAINKEIVLVFLLIIFLWWLFQPYFREAFNDKTNTVVGINEPHYGLRGNLLKQTCMTNLYQSPYRQLMLNDSTGEMWSANGTPPSMGIKQCRKVRCPKNGEYDNQDTCWKCGNDCPTKMKIPDIHPHTPCC